MITSDLFVEENKVIPALVKIFYLNKAGVTVSKLA